MSRYNEWHHANGEKEAVQDLSGHVLLNLINDIEAGRTLPREPADVFMPDFSSAHDYPNDRRWERAREREASRDRERECWLHVLKGIALQRGLNWESPHLHLDLIAYAAEIVLLPENTKLHEPPLPRKQLLDLAGRMTEVLRKIGIIVPTVEFRKKTLDVEELNWNSIPRRHT